MSWSDILKLIEQYFSQIGNPDDWQLSVNGAHVGKVTKVTFTLTDAHFEFNDGTADHTLDAKPGTVQHADVYFDNALQASARLIVRVTAQILKPLIIICQFEEVKNSGKQVEYRFDFPKNPLQI